jgi:hypothetical protein
MPALISFVDHTQAPNDLPPGVPYYIHPLPIGYPQLFNGQYVQQPFVQGTSVQFPITESIQGGPIRLPIFEENPANTYPHTQGVFHGYSEPRPYEEIPMEAASTHVYQAMREFEAFCDSADTDSPAKLPDRIVDQLLERVARPEAEKGPGSRNGAAFFRCRWPCCGKETKRKPNAISHLFSHASYKPFGCPSWSVRSYTRSIRTLLTMFYQQSQSFQV